MQAVPAPLAQNVQGAWARKENEKLRLNSGPTKFGWTGPFFLSLDQSTSKFQEAVENLCYRPPINSGKIVNEMKNINLLFQVSTFKAFALGESMGAAEDDVKEAPQEPSRPPPFVEVTCKVSGKVRRFAAGTQAGFALHEINRRREIGVPPVFLIEAAKEGEEPVSFGPTSILVDYGEGWRLQTVPEEGTGYEAQATVTEVKSSANFQRKGKSLSVLYVGKILLAFGFIFLIGGIFTLFLENLPWLIMIVNTSL
ncbi:hypothetical protein H6P81_004945 [Aristolochia fimbriata]|uniref:Uncharacterized protein n=1 Tax=Aristolochia fimbriata TaxID=158543 RepID=A0AAV7EWM3_ARIFI|nr:hypothetical protein H6P81_004945 [Aristolochia fimbriata]